MPVSGNPADILETALLGASSSALTAMCLVSELLLGFGYPSLMSRWLVSREPKFG